MSVFNRFSSVVAPIPDDLNRVITRHAVEIGKQSVGKLFSGNRGVGVMLEPWQRMFLDVAEMREIPLNEEEAGELASSLITELESVDGGINVAEAVLSRGVLVIGSLAIRISRNAMLTYAVGRAVCYALHEYDGNLTVPEICMVVFGRSPR